MYQYCEYRYEKAEMAFLGLMKSSEVWAGGDYIFRGQSDSGHLLLPSAWRGTKETDSIFERTKLKILNDFSGENIQKVLKKEIDSFYLDGGYSKRLEDYVWRLTCELYLTHEFTRRSNIVGLEVTKPNPFGRLSDFRDIMTLQYRILYGDEFGILGRHLQKESVISQIKSAFMDSEFDLMSYGSRYFSEMYFPAFALAQHHGIPTRFLDWSRSPWKALFFAIEKAQPGQDLAVYSLNTFVLNKKGIHYTDEFPHYKFTFLHRQEGVFTYLPYADGWYLKYGKWPSFEDWLIYLKETEYPIVKMVIPASEKDKLLYLLEKENITKESLMPTYDHVASSTLTNILRK